MSRYLIALCLLGAAGLAQADLRDAANCRAALTALEAGEADALARAGARAENAPRPEIGVRLAERRRAAARACLGGDGEPPAERRSTTLAVPRVPSPRPPAAAAPRAPVPASPVAAPAVIVTACDSVGCWASDGTRLHRVGPNLQGPRGLCRVEGPVLVCP